MLMLHDSSRREGLDQYSSRLSLLGISSGLLAFFIFCWVTSRGSEFADSAVENFLLLGICIYGAGVVFVEYRATHLLSPLALFFLTFVGHFGVTGLMYQYTTFFVNRGNSEHVLGSLIYLLLFMAVFHLSYRMFVPAGFRTRYDASTMTRSWRADRAIFAIVVLLVLGSLIRIYIVYLGIYLHTSLGTDEGARRIPFIGIIRNMENWPGYAALLATILYYRIRSITPTKAKIIGLSAIMLNGLNILYWIPTAAKFSIITAVLGPFAVHYLYTGRLPNRSIMATSIVFVIGLFPLTHMYRAAQVKLLASRDIGSIDSVATIFSETIANLGNAREVGAGNQVLGRLNQMEPVAAAVRIVNDGIVPLNWGRDYVNVLINMVPRFVWPDKPDVFYGNRFGHLAGMVSARDQYTSVSVTLPAEAYLNFDFAGALVAALIAGIFCSIYRLSRTIRCYDNWVLLYVATIPTTLYIGASFALYISSLLQTLALLILTTAAIGWKQGDRIARRTGSLRQSSTYLQNRIQP